MLQRSYDFCDLPDQLDHLAGDETRHASRTETDGVMYRMVTLPNSVVPAQAV
jgi:hypothetical protein